MGLCEELCDACDKMGWKVPTNIQRDAIPVALKGSDVLGLAETGSGKTAAFGLPILQALLQAPQSNFALVLTPTRELAIQIKEQLEALGSELGLSCCAVVGGVPMVEQAIALLRGPHIIVATLGRLVDHINELKGFAETLSSVKYLVMDEADRILNLDFEEEVDRVIRALPRSRTTMLFSATITNKVRELQRAHLKDAVRIEVNSSFKIVDTLTQYMISVAFSDRHLYLVYLLRQLKNKSVIVFCNSRANTIKTALTLRHCGHGAVPLYGDMTQDRRQQALAKFKEQERSVLVGTNVASRGLDIPCVDYVINFEVPGSCEDYVHRVGRTARAGRPGVAISFVSELEIEDFLRLEQQVVPSDGSMAVYPTDTVAIDKLRGRVALAEKSARQEKRRIEDVRRGGSADTDSEDDTEEATGVRKRLKRADAPAPTRAKPKKFKKTKRRK